MASLLPSFLASPNSDPKRFPFKVVEPDTWGVGEVFQVDDLLDFPTEDDIGSLIGEDCPSSFSAHTNDSSVTHAQTYSSHWSEKNHSRAVAANVLQEVGQPSNELCVPPDELVDQLEWLSTFVEDSYSTDTSLAPLVSSSGDVTGYNASSKDVYTTTDAFQSSSPVSVLEQSGAFPGRPCSLISPTLVVPGRARSKRSRAGSRVWSLDTLAPNLVENSVGVSDTDFSADSEISSSEQEADISFRPPKKTKKINQGNKISETSQPRRCSHCLVQKTPQWRAGPMGPKTLCNACGVRYKSGRLVPEYRPAGSPSFVSDVHSNSHKRILEMRRVKESELPQQDTIHEGDSKNFDTRPEAQESQDLDTRPEADEEDTITKEADRKEEDRNVGETTH